MPCTDEKKGTNHNFVASWALGMNDYEIAKSFGINVETLRNVKRDLNLDDPVQYYREHPAPEGSDQSR